MKKKIASLLLVCIVALSIVYVCSTTLYSRITQSMDAMPSRSTIVTDEIYQKEKLHSPEPPLKVTGDPVEDVKPH